MPAILTDSNTIGVTMNRKPIHGPDNPHPLSTMRTELVWEGKYDEWGNRREVEVAGCAMPIPATVMMR
jgi:hypothetical protein